MSHPQSNTHPALTEATAADLEVMRAQLGRPMRGVVGIAARCVCGNPTVVATEPRLPDGTPFPTFYYLTHPGATAAMSALEATQVMREFSELLEAAGVDTVKELRHRNPANLAAALLATNEEKKLVRRVPTEKEVVKMVEQAKELEPVVEY